MAERLRVAEAARTAKLQSIAQRAANTVSHAKRVSRAARESDALLRAALRRECQKKLDAAYARRMMHLSSISAAHAGCSPSAFLRRSAERVQVRTTVPRVLGPLLLGPL